MRKLLLADDEPYVTAVLLRRLGPFFDEVLTATDGQEALALAFEHRPALLISDFQMPVMDGYQLASQLYSDPRTSQLPVILLTARGHLLSPEQLARTNIRRTVAKPFAATQVISAAQEILASLEDRRAA